MPQETSANVMGDHNSLQNGKCSDLMIFISDPLFTPHLQSTQDELIIKSFTPFYYIYDTDDSRTQKHD